MSVVRHVLSAPVLCAVTLLFGVSACYASELSFSAPRYTVNEGDVATVTVTRTGDSRGVVKVDYCAYSGAFDTAFAVEPGKIDTSNGTAGDYVPCRSRIRNLGNNPVGWPYNIAAAGTLVFHDGETRKTFTITTLADQKVEGNETLSMVLRNTQGHAVLGMPADAQLVINDAHAPVAGVLQFSSPLHHTRGGVAGTTMITVTRTCGASGAISAAYTTVAADVCYYKDKTLTDQEIAVPKATAGMEYTETAGVLKWADGDAAPKTFTVPTLACTSSGIKNVALTLSNPTGGAALGTCKNADLSIVCPSTNNVYTLCDRTALSFMPKSSAQHQATGAPFKVWLPSNTAVIAGVFFPIDLNDRLTQVISQEWGFALAQFSGLVYEAEDPTQIAVLDNTLKQIAAATLHPEIANAPIATQSFSSVGGACFECLANPESALGFVAISGGHLKNSGAFEHDPYEKFFSHAPMTEGARSVPGIFCDGDLDKLLDPGTGLTRDVLIETYFTALRAQGGLTAFTIEWNTGHGCHEATHELGWYFLDRVIKMRNPSGMLPGIHLGERVPLRKIVEKDGWLGEKPVLDKEKTSRFLMIAPATEYAGDKNLLTSWLPDEGVAKAYRSLASLYPQETTVGPWRPPVVVNSPPARWISPPGRITFNIDPGTFTNIKQMVCTDESGAILGERTERPWQFSGTFAPGIHAVTILTTNTDNKQVVSFRVIICDLTGVKPPTVAGPESLMVNAGQPASFTVAPTGTAPFTYQWQKDGWKISGANNATFTIASVKTTDAGSYTVLVRNAAGNIMSAGASLTVKP